MFQIDNPNKFANKFKLKSSRLNNWNYSSPGYYFITICTLNKNNFFGKITNNQMKLNKKGEIVKSVLLKTFKIRKNIRLHEYIIMPNHVHILMEIKNQIDNKYVETPRGASLQSTPSEKYFVQISIKSKQEIPKLINQLKSSVKRICNQNNLFFAWQTRYHDIIIKDQKQYFTIKNYIKNNVINWNKDKYFVQS